MTVLRISAALVALTLAGITEAAPKGKLPQNKPSKSGQGKLDPQSAALLRAQFDRLDANQDGQIDPEEAATALRGPMAKPAPGLTLGDELANPEIKPDPRLPDVKLFQLMDTNGDRLISYKELEAPYARNLALQKQQLQAIQKQFHAMQQHIAPKRKLGQRNRQAQRRPGQTPNQQTRNQQARNQRVKALQKQRQAAQRKAVQQARKRRK